MTEPAKKYPSAGWGMLEIKGIGRNPEALEKYADARLLDLEVGDLADYLVQLGFDVRLRKPTTKTLERRKAEFERWKRDRDARAAAKAAGNQTTEKP